MDSLPPNPPPPPMLAPPPATYAYGPGDIYPNTGPHAAEERDLCDKAASPDWLYLIGLAALDVASVWADSEWKYAGSYAGRLVGPSAIGFAWGATLGGGYLAMPKCDRHWVTYPPREGEVHSSWPLALAIAGVAGATAPVIMGTAQGILPVEWTTEERFAHVAFSSGMAIVGALLPYALPPRTWRAARELSRIRASADGKSAFVGYTLSF